MSEIGEMSDEAFDSSADGRLGQVLALAQEWGEQGAIARSDFTRIVEEVDLPARLYRTAVEAVTAVGVEIIDDADPDDDDEADDDSGGGESDPYGRLLAHKILTQAEEASLGRRIEQGHLAAEALLRSDLPPEVRADLERQVRDGRSAADEFVEHNHRLVMSAVQKYRWACSPGLDVDDLFEEGYLGLATAVEKFDWRRSLKFSTYATWWIRQSITRAIADKSRAIRLPVHAHEALIRVIKARDELLRAHERPSIAALARATGLSETQVRTYLAMGRDLQSLDRVIGDGSQTVGAQVADDDDSGPEAQVLQHQLQELIDEALCGLKPREQDIIRRRFGLGGCEPQTLEEIGQEYGVTRERIRQIEGLALGHLRATRRRFEAFTSPGPKEDG